MEPYLRILLRERLFLSFLYYLIVGFLSVRRLPTTELACRYISKVADFLTDLVDLRERVDLAEGSGSPKYSTLGCFVFCFKCRDLPVPPVIGDEKSDKS